MLRIISWSLEMQHEDTELCDTRLLEETWLHQDEYVEKADAVVLYAIDHEVTIRTNDYLFFCCVRASILKVGLLGTTFVYWSDDHQYEEANIDSQGRLDYWPKSHFDLFGTVLRELL